MVVVAGRAMETRCKKAKMSMMAMLGEVERVLGKLVRKIIETNKVELFAYVNESWAY